jgi:6-phosphogluconolactonase
VSQFGSQEGSADIHVSPDGRFLYCSNRGESNSITCFRIQEDGKLIFLYNNPSLGIAPRNFNFDASGNFLLVAHQKSDNIVIFKIDRSSGYITDTGKRIDVGNPVCVKWLQIN